MNTGIYVGVFPGTDGAKEYRVCYAEMLENTFEGTLTETGRQITKEVADAERYFYFGESPVFSNEDDAWKHARERHNQAVSRLLWWGVYQVNYDRPFPERSDIAAREIMKQFWKTPGGS